MRFSFRFFRSPFFSFFFFLFLFPLLLAPLSPSLSFSFPLSYQQCVDVVLHHERAQQPDPQERGREDLRLQAQAAAVALADELVGEDGDAAEVHRLGEHEEVVVVLDDEPEDAEELWRVLRRGGREGGREWRFFFFFKVEEVERGENDGQIQSRSLFFSRFRSLARNFASLEGTQSPRPRDRSIRDLSTRDAKEKARRGVREAQRSEGAP